MTGEEAFIAESRRLLLGSYLPRIRACLESLSEDDVWWRPHPTSNAVGNLVLHLCGNIRQWVVGGLGGEADVRERAAEFEGDGVADRAGLVTHLERTLADVDRALAGLDPADLHQRRVVQGKDVSGLEALYHAVEHFSMHTGQIVYVTKMRLGRDLGFYQVSDGVATPRWASGGDGPS